MVQLQPLYLHIHRIAATKTANYMPRAQSLQAQLKGSSNILSKHVHGSDPYYVSLVNTFRWGKNKEKELTSEIKATSFGNRAL